MILPKIDAQRFVTLVSDAPLIAFQRLEYGAAVAAPGEAYYAPIDHPGGGNLDFFHVRLALASLIRMSQPALRTLRPTAQPTPIVVIDVKKISGDDPVMIEFATQVVINTIEQHGRPDLQATMDTLKLGMMIEALDLVVEHALQAKEGCELDQNPMRIRLNIMQAVQAMKSVLEMMLKP